MGRSYLAISWCFKAPKILEFWNFVRKISHFFKKIKCSKQPKKQNKLNFYFSLSGVPNVRGGWVGSDVWDKVPNKYVFFWHLPLPFTVSRVTDIKIGRSWWKARWTTTSRWAKTRQHCRLTICMKLVELTNSIRRQDANNNTNTEVHTWYLSRTPRTASV